MWLVIGIGDQPLNYVPPTILKLKHWEDRFQCLIIQVNILNLLTKSQDSLTFAHILLHEPMLSSFPFIIQPVTFTVLLTLLTLYYSGVVVMFIFTLAFYT